MGKWKLMITLDLVDRTKDATEESIELVRSFIEEDTHLNYDDLKVETMLSRGAPSMIVKKVISKFQDGTSSIGPSLEARKNLVLL